MRSPWRLAAILFLCLGVPILIFGSWLIVEGLPRINEQQLAALVAPFGVVIALYGLGHIACAYLLWRERATAFWLGLPIAFLGALVGFLVLPNAFNHVYTIVDFNTMQVVDSGIEIRSVLLGLSVVPYMALIALQLAAALTVVRPRPSHQP